MKKSVFLALVFACLCARLKAQQYSQPVYLVYATGEGFLDVDDKYNRSHKIKILLISKHLFWFKEDLTGNQETNLFLDFNDLAKEINTEEEIMAVADSRKPELFGEVEAISLSTVNNALPGYRLYVDQRYRSSAAASVEKIRADMIAEYRKKGYVIRQIDFTPDIENRDYTYWDKSTTPEGWQKLTLYKTRPLSTLEVLPYHKGEFKEMTEKAIKAESALKSEKTASKKKETKKEKPRELTAAEHYRMSMRSNFVQNYNAIMEIEKNPFLESKYVPNGYTLESYKQMWIKAGEDYVATYGDREIARMVENLKKTTKPAKAAALAVSMFEAASKIQVEYLSSLNNFKSRGSIFDDENADTATFKFSSLTLKFLFGDGKHVKFMLGAGVSWADIGDYRINYKRDQNDIPSGLPQHGRYYGVGTITYLNAMAGFHGMHRLDKKNAPNTFDLTWEIAGTASILGKSAYGEKVSSDKSTFTPDLASVRGMMGLDVYFGDVFGIGVMGGANYFFMKDRVSGSLYHDGDVYPYEASMSNKTKLQPSVMVTVNFRLNK